MAPCQPKWSKAEEEYFFCNFHLFQEMALAGVGLLALRGALVGQRWANNSVFEYIRIIWTEYIRIPNYSVLFKNRIIFVFVFGWNFQTEYIRIRIRLKISNRIYSYSYSVGRKFEYYSNSWIVEKITFERPQNNSRLTRPIGVGGSD